MRRTVKVYCMAMVLSVFAPVQDTCAMELPHDALKLMAAAASDPCSICAQQQLEKAFALLKERCPAGSVISTDAGCRMVKTGDGGGELSLTCYPAAMEEESLGEGQSLPRIVFAFYTQQDRLVGISQSDYTDTSTAERYRASGPGTVFDARLRLIPYRYGDGPTFNYFPHTHTLRFHCIILEMKAVPPKE
ncbi:MAG TPA: hypothetical protein PLR71_06365 [Deltaproteobacteria bacterium]|nr:hypothetical protein [Deltaproteobacteria bacterium]